MGFAHVYADAILHRGRVPMEPADFVPDWADKPRKAKHYPGALSFPLPEGGDPAAATVRRGLFGAGASARRPDPDGAGAAGPAGARPFTPPLLGGMLLDSYGLTGRRLGVTANTDLGALPWYPDANWSRGTASGGGLYPVGVYWVSGPGGPLPPGVHHYAPGHHAVRRLLAGDATAEVRAALRDRDGGRWAPAERTDQFLVLGVKYWQNAFKYNNFGFHAVSMDVGALLQTWRLWAGARGLRVEPAMWFDEERLARLLGVDPEEEGVFAVVPLPWERAPGTDGGAEPAAPPRVRRTDEERSRTVLAFETLLRMQRATARDAAVRPGPGALQAAAPAPAPAPAGEGERIALPEPPPLDMTVRRALRGRRSSFGRFEAGQPLEAAELAGALAASAAVVPDGDTPGPRLTRLYAFVSHVRGIAPGAYAYEPQDRSLRLVKAGPPGEFLQRNYFLANYNLEQAGAVLVPAVRTTAVLDAVGDRGYRLVGATVGAVAQNFYTAASAMGLGAGVALGFDNISYIEELGLAGTGEAPLLIMLLGRERSGPADFRYEIA